jgi:hypothetical protein
MSLRTRLSLLTVGLLLVLLVAGGIFQYFALGQYLFRDEAQILQQRYTQTIRDLTIRGRACTAAGQLASGAALGAGAKLVPPVVGGHITTAAADCIVRAASGTLVTAVLIDNGGGRGGFGAGRRLPAHPGSGGLLQRHPGKDQALLLDRQRV